MSDSKEEFNKYCAGVMGVKFKSAMNTTGIYWHSEYDPYNDLNQMQQSFDILSKNWLTNDSHMFGDDTHNRGIKTAMRNFIISTMEK